MWQIDCVLHAFQVNYVENKAFFTKAECYAYNDPHLKTADGR